MAPGYQRGDLVAGRDFVRTQASWLAQVAPSSRHRKVREPLVAFGPPHGVRTTSGTSVATNGPIWHSFLDTESFRSQVAMVCLLARANHPRG